MKNLLNPHRLLPTLVSLPAMLTALLVASSPPLHADGMQLLNNGRPVLVREMPKPLDREAHPPSPTPSTENIKLPKDPAGQPQGVFEAPLLQLPLRNTIGNSPVVFYSISNFVDQDEAYPNSVRDYNCGERTYDTESGGNHNGIDFGLSHFTWRNMADETTAIVAAADGTIIERHDGEPDMSCAFDENADPNFITLEHADGSKTVYVHMKAGTVTPRHVGDTVEAGDYLGMVGSSGFSTGPHLHLGVYDAGDDLIEPFAGSCNDLNDDSWWIEQEPYHNKVINFIATHGAQPEYPPCPQPEVPHIQTIFEPGGLLHFSGVFRDIERDDVVHVKVTSPSSQAVIEFDYTQDSVDFAEGLTVIWGVQFSGAEAAGTYKLSLTYDGQTADHDFYIDSAPETPPAAVAANNAYNGLWYDPDLEGEGYNFVFTPSGGIVYFYGSDLRGNRIWLISDLIYGTIGTTAPIEVVMYESTGGTFPTPVKSARGLSEWGSVEIDFDDCNNGTATLSGVDGNKVSDIVKLAGVAGTTCTSGAARADSPWSGLWYDPSDEGEGYNLLVAPNGSILYFYGFKEDGLRLWLISDLIQEPLEIDDDVSIEVYEATEGIFATPVPSEDALVQWGTATIRLVDCNHIRIQLSGTDGNKISNTLRLASIVGIACS